MLIRILYCLVILNLLTVFSSAYADDNYPVFSYHKFTYQGEEVEISTKFNNGGLYKVEETETNVFDVWPYAYEEYNHGWVYLESFTRPGNYDNTGFCFHFRITGCKNKKIVFNFHIKESIEDGKERNTLFYANPDFPVFSYDEAIWERMSTKSMKKHPTDQYWVTVTVEQEFLEDTAYIAFQYPYSSTYLEKLIARVQDSPFCTVGNAGRSTEGKDIKLFSITNPDVALKKKKVAWFTGLQHTSELGAGRGLEAMIDFLVSDDPIAYEARDYYLFNIIPLVNVDAVDEGRGRTHSSGRNLNREWMNTYPKPEIASILQTFNEWTDNGNAFDLFIDFHGFSGVNGEFLLLHPDTTYTDEVKLHYDVLMAEIKKQLPHSKSARFSVIGLAGDTVFDQFGALTLTIDAWIYDKPVPPLLSHLSTYYESGRTIYALEDVQESAANYVKAIVEYAKAFQVSEIEEEKPSPLKLNQNYPNPFNSETTISFTVPSTGTTLVSIYNITGQLVRTLLHESLQQGVHSTLWDGKDTQGNILESGIYLLRLQHGDFSSTRKILHLK